MRHSDQVKLPFLMNDQDLKTNGHDEILEFAFSSVAKDSKLAAQILASAIETPFYKEHLKNKNILTSNSMLIEIEPVYHCNLGRIDNFGRQSQILKTISPDMVVNIDTEYKEVWTQGSGNEKTEGFCKRSFNQKVLVELKTSVNVGETIRQLNYYRSVMSFFKTILFCPPISKTQVELLNHAGINVVLYRK